jgi:hypothetical protein
VDTGRLRASIATEVRSDGFLGSGLVAAVGSNVIYAPHMELGTGTFAGRKRHYPPPSALATWARRHGTNAWAVAAAIGRRGGLRPRRFLRGALEANRAQIIRILDRRVTEITLRRGGRG